jgi:hypothetical protein
MAPVRQFESGIFEELLFARKDDPSEGVYEGVVFTAKQLSD